MRRVPLIVEAVDRLKVRSCLIDGEAVACDETGSRCSNGCGASRRASMSLYAFDLIELDGQDLWREPLDTRKVTLASLLRRSLPGLRFLNEHLAHDGESVSRHACKMGLEGHRLETARVALPIRPVEGLADVQEPGSASGEARGEGGLGPEAMAVKKTEKTRTHFTFRIDTWTADGESIVEHLARRRGLTLALA